MKYSTAIGTSDFPIAGSRRTVAVDVDCVPKPSFDSGEGG